jgi:hypothetical protein
MDNRRWRSLTKGEPVLMELLEDPILHLVMRRDGVTEESLQTVIAQAQANLWRRLCRTFPTAA